MDPMREPEDPTPEQLLIGWKEFIDFPDWGIRHVRAKVDTGAWTSALDVASYDLRHTAEGGLVATLRLAWDRRRPQKLSVVETPVLRTVVVSNSSGMREQRPLIETLVRLGPRVKPVRLTVANRAGMRFRVILGRQALAGDFVVDVSEKYLLGK
jgi:hypothetical protein